MGNEPVLILLVEDNEDHAELVKRTLLQIDDKVRIVHVRDGEAALAYLGLTGEPSGLSANPKPGLVLLDLRLPRIDGLDVLHRIKHAVALRPIPVVVLTTSSAPSDVARAYASHANSFITKPASFERFDAMINDLKRYWMDWNVVPHPQE